MGISIEALDEFLEECQSPSQLPGLFNLMYLSGVSSNMPGDAQPLLTMQKMALRFVEEFGEVAQRGHGELFASEFVLALKAFIKADQESHEKYLKCKRKAPS